MPFKDLDEFFKIQPIRLPIRGKTYAFPGSVSGRTGLLLHRMTEMAERVKDGKEAPELGQQILDDSEELDLRTEILGDGEKAMLDDGLPAVFIDHVFHTLIVWHQFGENVAKAVWEDVPNGPKAPQDRRAKSRRGTSAGATTTRRRASTTGTNGSAPASSGDESSSSGV
jgi:hypothetical protein